VSYVLIETKFDVLVEKSNVYAEECKSSVLTNDKARGTETHNSGRALAINNPRVVVANAI
jgi:hypothetical protein